MGGKKPFILVVLIAGVLLLGANMFVQTRLDDSIRKNKLIDEQFVQGAPPLVAFTTMALGGFRGIIADFLWFRAMGLQDEGKYFEMVQLASWIMKLQPKSTASAAYLGWNMAYNISVTCSRAEDRWRWVNKGIELYLEALQYNPNDPVLYKELGWIYQHKLGNVLDDAQRYYKWQLALQMYKILGEHYPDWKRLAAAPATTQEYLAQHKDSLTFRKSLLENGFKDLDQVYLAFRNSGGIMPQKVLALFAKEPPAELQKLTDCFRVRYLYERFLMKPEKILAINQKYGELDWFLPESFAIYWAVVGTERSPKRQNVDCDRMITQSLQVTFTNGRMLYPGKEPSMTFILLPNLAVADAVRDSYRTAMDQNPGVPSFIHAFRNFMTRAILTMFSYGAYDKATAYYREMRQKDSGHRANHFTLEQFVYDSWAEEMKSIGYKQAQDLISGMIVKACMLIAYGDTVAAESNLRMAEICYRRYEKDQDVERVKLVSFAQMKAFIAGTVIRSLPPELAARLKGFAALEAQKKNETSPDGANAAPAAPAPAR